ncbi:MAG: hypothetical protein Q4A84_10330 [Neisseria sp.]|uniref:hypothetical protein n=1 Tax=Neisseria sp. TaxID=192066 RepID=UPI0026DB8475|nr:hypothetical protein [Neisseria sp.]MDO4642073.1 hypothetical protein [Neisseria sp.]
MTRGWCGTTGGIIAAGLVNVAGAWVNPVVGEVIGWWEFVGECCGVAVGEGGLLRIEKSLSENVFRQAFYAALL